MSSTMTSPTEIINIIDVEEGNQGVDNFGLQILSEDGLADKNKNNDLKLPSVAVAITNAHKHYGGKKSPAVLNGLNMTVEAGTIYSLLGASGCGKTTLLSCILGLSKLNSGDIFVLGGKPGQKQCGVPGKRVGYMPQELALFGQFSIHESLSFYGSMYSMTTKQIEENIVFLIEFLKLPPADRTVNTLSGGQRRRVSFACSMIHNPELLILDEPTVGVDALLRKSIWDHLGKLVATGKTTVIITTHYIDEARFSNKVGMMRHGKLLVEDDPNDLLIKYKTQSLEDIVLVLCLKDQVVDEDNEDEIAAVENGKSCTRTGETIAAASYKKIEEAESKFCMGGSQQKAVHWHRASLVSQLGLKSTKTCEEMQDSWNRIHTLCVKNAKTATRNLLFLAYMLLCPALQAIVACTAIGGTSKGLHIGVVNYELFNTTECPIPMTSPGCPFFNDFNGLLSCHFLDLLDKDIIKVVNYECEDDAIRDVKDSKLWGMVVFADNYTESVRERGIFGSTAELSHIYGSRVRLWMDFSNKQIGVEIEKAFYTALNDLMRNVATACETDPVNLEVPLTLEKPIYGKVDISFQEYIAPSILLGVVFFFPVASSGLSYITEKRIGTLDRSLVAGVTHAEFMLSYAVVQIVILFIQISAAFACLIFIFRIEIHGPFSLAFTIAILVGVAGVSMGFILSAVCTQEIQAVILAMGMFVPNLLLAGLIWPLEGMPTSLQYIAYILPCTLACESMRSIVSRGVGISHSKVWPGVLSTLAWIVFYWIVLTVIHKLKRRK